MWQIILNIILLLLVAVRLYYPQHPLNRIIFLDVGQGDATLIQLAGKNILIDAGPSDRLLYQLGQYLNPIEVRIDLLILTHPHLDHISGALYLLERYQVDSILLNPVCYSSPHYAQLWRYKEKFLYAYDIERFDVGLARIEVINPKIANNAVQCESGVGLRSSADGNVNNDSIVLLFSYLGWKVLLTGDAEKELEESLIQNHRVDDIDILKAGHHCSKSSTTEEFLKRSRPEYVICSFGEGNSYGHPSPETLERIGKIGATVFMTSRDGSIIFNLDRL